MSDQEPLNDGLIWFRDHDGEIDGHAPRTLPRTLIVTGSARSGTSMIARLLSIAGVPMGPSAVEPVFEDVARRDALAGGGLDEEIAARDDAYPVWGFKHPDLHDVLPYWELSRFRAPALICTVRDPVAVAVRVSRAEHLPYLQGLLHASHRLTAMLDYMRAAPCPVLLVSYEKAITLRDELVAAVIAFCGIEPDRATSEAMLNAIAPNRAEYAEFARRHFEGYVDSLVWPHLFGWCRDMRRATPLDVVLSIDGLDVLVTTASLFREDLRAAGIGDGRHGFAFDLAGLSLDETSLIDVRIAGRSVSLLSGGRPAGSLRAGAEVVAS